MNPSFVRYTWALKCAWIGFAFLVFFAGICVGQQKRAPESFDEPTYRYETDGIRLEGIVAIHTFYGPPGFGETPREDERDRVFILKLKSPITVEPLPSAKAKDSSDLDTFRNIQEIQLTVTGTQIDAARKLLGKRVIAIGRLHEAILPGEHTKVWLDVRTLSAK